MSPEQARRALLEELRARPRPEADAPVLTAWFPREAISRRAQLEILLVLMRALLGVTKYFQTWRLVLTPDDQKSGTGLFPLESPEH